MSTLPKRELILLTLCVLLGVALFYVVMLNLFGLHLSGTVIDYSRFGTWSQAISGTATTSALVVALASLYSQRSIYRSAESRRVIEEETAVFHWLTFKEVRDDANNLIGRLWDIRIQNSTAAPIYCWKLSFSSDSGHLCNHVKRPLLPGENVFNVAALDHLDPSNAPEPVLIFAGRSAKIWTRSALGILVQCTQKELDCPHTQTVG